MSSLWKVAKVNGNRTISFMHTIMGLCNMGCRITKFFLTHCTVASLKTIIQESRSQKLMQLQCISWYCTVVGVICNIVTLWCCSSCLSILLSAAFLCTQDRRNKHLHGDVIYCTFWLSCSEWVLNYLTTTVLPDKDIGKSLYGPLKVIFNVPCDTTCRFVTDKLALFICIGYHPQVTASIC